MIDDSNNEQEGSGSVASPRCHDNGKRSVTSTSSTPPPSSATTSLGIQTLKFQPLPFLMPAAATTAPMPTNTTPTKTLDKNPLWIHGTNNSIPSSLGGSGNNSSSSAGLKSIFFPSSIPGLTGGEVGGSGLILKSPPTTMPPSSVVGGTTIHPPPSLMYQFMATPQNCLTNPFLGAAANTAAVLTVIPSPPAPNLVNPPQSVFLVANQNFAGKPLLPAAAPQQAQDEYESAKHANEGNSLTRGKSLAATDMEPATGQAQYPSTIVSSTTTVSLPPPHPRTLASIPPAELTPQHLELKAFAEDFKTRRIRLGFTQGAVGTSLAEKGYNNFAQSTISRFEQMQLSPANAATIRVILEKWLHEAESPETAPSNQSNDLSMMAGRKRKKRAVFTPQTKSILDEFFAQNPRPNHQAIEGISQKLDLLPEEVRVWFCNKRQKSKSGSVSTPYDRESSSTTSSGVPSPTISEGGQSQKRRSPSPPKTPFTIKELSKSSFNGSSGFISSPVHLSTSSLLPLGGLVASVTQSMNQPLIFTSGGSPPMLFRGGAGNKSPPLVLPPQFLASSPIITDPSLN